MAEEDSERDIALIMLWSAIGLIFIGYFTFSALFRMEVENDASCTARCGARRPPRRPRLAAAPRPPPARPGLPRPGRRPPRAPPRSSRSPAPRLRLAAAAATPLTLRAPPAADKGGLGLVSGVRRVAAV